ncbi:MAG: hypothetical protein EOO38_04440 [Cytophagaceae bacterium]|nr:MAG: hypothetical protein EOO38_04440 [Cytophagaceae bacterium]
MTDLSLTYDSLGRQKTISDSVGTTTVSYDNLGRLTSEDGPWANDTLTFNYGSRNELQSLIVGRDGTTNDAIAYTYNTAANILGTPATVSATLGSWGSTGTFTYGYSGVVPTTFDRPNGVRTTYTYEPLLDRVSGVQNALVTPATNQSKFTYAYGTTGANASPEGFRDVQSTQTRQYAAQPQQTLTYGYDRSSRLTAEDATVGGANTPAIAAWASFDAMGNRTQWQNDVAQHNFQATYNTANQITQVRRNSVATPPDSTQTATTNFGYDAAGNQTSAVLLNGASVVQSTVTYTYDDLDRLTSIATVGSDKWEFIYDGSSRLRISKYYLWQTGGTPQWVEQVAQQKRRVYSGNDIVQERNSSNVVTASLVRDGGVGGLLARVTSSATADQVFYSYDMAGNVTSLSDKTGTAVAYYTYDSWGNTLAMTGTKASANPYRYTTKESFGGYYHFGYRFYNPGIGRWLNRDPLGEDGGPNLYTFSNNSPNNFIDPDGAITHILAGAAIGGTIGAVFEGGREIWNGGSVGSVAKAALRGGVVGAVSGATGAWIAPVATAALGGTIYAGAAGGAIAGAAGDAAGQGLELAVGWRCKFDVGEMVMAGGMGGIGGALGAKAKLGTNCFVAGTPVVMADGSNKEIEQVKEGDLVLSRDEATGETAAKKVEHTSLRQADATLLFTFSDGTEVECSDEHPFYVESQGFKPAREIGVGTSIVTKAGPAHVIKVEQKHEQKNLYNFTVEGFHTYFVGRSALWVHNAPCETLIRYGSDAEAESIKLSQKLSFRPGHKGPDGGVKWVGGPQATINPKNLGSTYKNKFVIHVKPGTTKWLQENNFELKPDVEPGRFAIPTASLDAFNERVTKIVVSALK